MHSNTKIEEEDYPISICETEGGQSLRTLELNVSCKRRELCHTEGSVVVNVRIWQGTRGGERGQVEGSDD